MSGLLTGYLGSPRLLIGEAAPSRTGYYEGPPVNKSPGVHKPPPGGPRGGPEEGGGRYQHFAEIVGALRAQVLRSESMHIGFHMILEVSWVGSLEIRVGGEGPGWLGLITFGPKIAGNSLEEEFYQAEVPRTKDHPAC
jgi:hypothetical protein